MPSRLRVEEILTVGFVDKGDDPEAEIVFFKSKDGDVDDKRSIIQKFLGLIGLKDDEVEKLLADGADDSSINDGDPNPDGDGPMTFDVSKLDEAGKAAFDAAVEAAVTARVNGEEVNDLPSDLPEPVMKAFNDLTALVEKANTRAETAEAAVAKLVDQGERAEYIAKAEALGLPGGNPDDFADILRKAEAGMTDEEREKFNEVMQGASAVIKASALLRPAGRDGIGDTSVAAEVEELAKSFRQDDPSLTTQMSRAKVWASRPDLYAQHRAENPLTGSNG